MEERAMKRKLILSAALFVLAAILCGCGAGGSVRFTGVVEEIRNDSILVSTKDDVGFTEAVVDISDVETPCLVIGGTLQITIDSLVSGSVPVQVTALKIKTAD